MTNIQMGWLIIGIAILVIMVGSEHILHGQLVESIKNRAKRSK